MKTKAEQQYIRAFAARIGGIDFAPGDDRVLNTAAAELKKFFEGCAFTGAGRLTVGLAHSAEVCALPQAEKLAVRAVDAKDDGFEVRRFGDSFVAAGANPRGVLYGVYELEDRILAGEAENPDTFIVPAFRKRSDAIGHYHNARTYNFGNDPIDEKKAEYLARLRINQFCACFDGSAFGNCLSDFVHSDVFPFQRQPLPEAVAMLKNSSSLLSKYGIEFHMMLWAPALPKLFAPIEAYPKGVLGRVRRPWGGDENHLDYTLCINHPLVQQHYRNIIPKFIREYPDVKGFFLYNMDGASWLCTPGLCPNCAKTLVDSDPAAHNPWETQAALVTLFADAAHRQDPDFAVSFWGTVHFHGESIAKMYRTAKGFDVLTTGCMGGDHDIYVTKQDAPVYEVAETLRAAKEHGVPACVYYAYNRLEAVQPGLPTPFAAIEALKLFRDWGFTNAMEVTGPTPCMNQITALTMRQFQSQPDTDAESWLSALAARQFGTAAGAHMVAAWKHIHRAFGCWRDYDASPLTGSQFMMRMGLFSNVSGAECILPGVLDAFDGFYMETLSGVEPFRREAYAKNLTPEFLERFTATEQHLAYAEAVAYRALEAAGNEPVGICYYEGGFEGIGRHTQKEFARLNLCSIRMTHAMCRQNIDILKAVALLRAMRDTPAMQAGLYPRYLRLLEEDRALLEEYVAMLEEFSVLRPCLPMTGMCENELRIYIGNAQERIERINTYLAANR